MSRRFDRDRQFTPDDVLPFITGTDDQPVELVELDVKVHVTGLFAETTQILRLHNPNSRDLEGELCFPLPHGAAVCGYGIDVDGKVVDGVVVPKQEARRILEAEIRKGVDPGLVEHTKGNVYRTRIYPLPAGGSRTVKLVYVTPLTIEGSEAAYHLPLGHAAQLDRVSLRLEVSQTPVEPIVTGGLGNLDLASFENRWVAEAELTSGAAADDLLIKLPRLPDHFTAVERLDGDDFFCVSCTIPSREEGRWSPERLGLLWDASGSRRDVDRELALLEALAGVWSSITFDVVVLRNVVEPETKTFRIEDGDASELLEFLRQTPRDGATNLAAVSLDQPPHADDEAWLLFSDGLDTVERGLPLGRSPRVLAITSQVQNDSSLLSYLAERSGGEFINLVTTTPEAAARRVLSSSDSLRLARAAGCEDVHVTISSGRLTVVGRLTEAIGSVYLEGPGAPDDQLSISRDQATEGRNAARAWAAEQARFEHLIGTPPDRIAELGRRYELVTPGTSLLVLETLDQHLEYDIEPPKSRPEMRVEFLGHRRERAESEEERYRRQLDRVIDLWERRVEWWERDFSARHERAGKDKKGMGPGDMGLEVYASSAPAPSMAQPSMMRSQSAAVPVDEDAMAFDEIADGEGFGAMQASSGFGGPGGGEMAKEEEASSGPTASVKIQPWSPDTPYLARLREVTDDDAYSTYLEQRPGYVDSPSFFIDCADHFLKNDQTDFGLRILSNLLELALDDPALLRRYAWRMQQSGELDEAIHTFERVLEMRDDEPQSHRDLALALELRWQRDGNPEDAVRAMQLLHAVVTRSWDRFPEIEVIALMELNRLLHFAEGEGIARPGYIDDRLVKLLDLDVRISMSWDADLTDVDLHVFEPTGEHAYYSHNLTEIGGLVSRDFTQGYGPEEYVLRRAVPGEYTIKTHYYGSHQQTIAGACTVIVNVFTNFARPDEERQVMTLRLEQASDEVLVGTITIDPEKMTPVSATSPDWMKAFRKLARGMTIDEITALVGQPEEMRGTDEVVLVYRPQHRVDIHVTTSPRLVAVEQVMNGARLDLLNLAKDATSAPVEQESQGLVDRLRQWWRGDDPVE